MWYCYNYFGLGHPIWGLMLLGLIPLILFIIFIILIFTSFSPRRTSNAAALETLKMKLATGEISIEEYERKKQVLKK